MPIANILPQQERPVRTYKLVFHENEQGRTKRVEVQASSFVEIIRMLRGDHAKRAVDVFVDGKFACHISHGDDAICVRRS